EARRARDAAGPQFAIQQRDRRRYDFLGEHGRGGIGRVVRAHDRDLGRDVAIKELLSRGSSHEARFLREVLITARLEHPGIVPVHEAGRWSDGTPFYAMKLVSGRPLRDLFAERPTVEARLSLLHHVIAVADAIAYAHERGIIHRDLKPANIIVGDFGETVVIDWGLAKDLTSTEEPAVIVADGTDAPDSAPISATASASASNDVTVAGAVLGTPAYMAPEQKYGEAVDQRADVFAIGTMLWELCAVQKSPPTDPEVRRKMLRGAGIDNDFIAIIDKALEPDAEYRYVNAGALAADLKAFRAGARITARSYSLLALLAHWTRRHKTLSLTTAVALLVALVGTTVYVRNIAIERDRADANETSAKLAQTTAETNLREVTLNHAQLQLTTDPTAAVDTLAGYQGARADQIRAEAHARGVASLRAQAHAEYIPWIAAAPDGAILSLSVDGTLTRTVHDPTTARDGTTTVLQRGGSRLSLPAYAETRQLLAYTCDPSDICMFDVGHGAGIPRAPALRNLRVSGTALSTDGSLLAVLLQDSTLQIFGVGDPAKPQLRLTKPIPGGLGVTFLDDTTAVVGSAKALAFVGVEGDVQSVVMTGVVGWDARPGDHSFAAATEAGQAYVFQGPGHRIAAQMALCAGPMVGAVFVPGRDELAYACRSGAVGLWDPRRKTTTQIAQLDGHANRVLASAAGDYLVIDNSNGSITLIDLQTQLTATYRGHGSLLSAVAAPSSVHPFVLSADIHGAIRAWPLPPRLAHVIDRSTSAYQAAVFDHGSILVTRWQPGLHTIAADGTAHDLASHAMVDSSIDHGDGDAFVAWGLSDVIELWSSASGAPVRTDVVPTGHGTVSALEFVRGSDRFLTAGSDGRVVQWTMTGDKAVLAEAGQPIDKLAVIGDRAGVYAMADGSLGRLGGAAAIKPAGPRITRLAAVIDRPAVYAGDLEGNVTAIATRTWQAISVLRTGGAIRDIASDGAHVAIASSDGNVSLAGIPADGIVGAASWIKLPIRVNGLTLLSDLLLMSGSDGTLWIYEISTRRWLCVPTGAVDLSHAIAAPGGKTAVVIDYDGRLLSLDLEAARTLIHATAGAPNRVDKQ
ncbi:MAG TPA: WD40 repeat domain-containing serine/threonine-protein kinase, partial [Kofleriaceae bacterium]